MKHAAPAWFKYSPSPCTKISLTEACLLPYSLAYCPDPDVKFQLANMGFPYNKSSGIRQLYIGRRKRAMVTGPEHLDFILEDIPFCLELMCSLYTIISPTL